MIKIKAGGIIQFEDGTRVEETDEAKYLGSLLNDNVEAKKELSKRIEDAHVVWEKLAEVWKNGNSDIREELIVQVILNQAFL